MVAASAPLVAPPGCGSLASLQAVNAAGRRLGLARPAPASCDHVTGVGVDDVGDGVDGGVDDGGGDYDITTRHQSHMYCHRHP